jgi:hypothetical protein
MTMQPGNNVSHPLLFKDLDAFEEVVRLSANSGTVPAELLLADLAQGKATNIDKATPVRVIERVNGGAKVQIAGGSHDGEEGWMLGNSFPEVSDEQK